MADLLGTGSSWLESMRSRWASELVTYRRGDASVSVSATRGRKSAQFIDEQGIAFRDDSWDWLIGVADLKLNDIATVPQKQDQIEDAHGVIFKVLPFGSFPEWEYSDPHRNTFRVHSKDVGELAPLTPG